MSHDRTIAAFLAAMFLCMIVSPHCDEFDTLSFMVDAESVSENPSVLSSSSYGWSDCVSLWLNRNHSESVYYFPYANQTPMSGMAFFQTDYVVVPPLTSTEGYNASTLNDSDVFSESCKIVVHMAAGGGVSGQCHEAMIIADEARNNSRIVGMMMDDFVVGSWSPENMRAVHASAHHEDENLSQGSLGLWLVVYGYNYFIDSPYTWESIDSYYDGVEIWYAPNTYGHEGWTVNAYEDAVRAFHARNVSKPLHLGVYLHYYHADYYPFEITRDLLASDARLISEGLAQRIAVLSHFWIPNNPETAHMVRNFVAEEMVGQRETMWNWTTDDVSTRKAGTTASDAVSLVSTRWIGNKTFVSHHHQRVTVTGFTGSAFTVQCVRSGDIVDVKHDASGWSFYASPMEEYRVSNWPRTLVVYEHSLTITKATEWNNLEVLVKGWLRVNATLWANNTILRFVDPLRRATTWNGTDPYVGIISNVSNDAKMYFENTTIEPLERAFPFFFNCSYSVVGTGKAFSIRNSTVAGYSGISFMGKVEVYDSVFFQTSPTGADYVDGIRDYAPGRTTEFRFVRNTVWTHYAGYARAFSIMPSHLNGTSKLTVSDNQFFGGKYGVATAGDFSDNSSFYNTGFGRTYHHDQPSTWGEYHPVTGVTCGATRFMWHFVKFSLKTDVVVTGTLYNSSGNAIGSYSSSNGFVNVSNILYAYYNSSGSVVVRNPFPWTFSITSALPAGYYYMLADTNLYTANRSSWDFPFNREFNSTSFQIWMEESCSLWVRQMPLCLYSGIDNYVSADSTLTWSDTMRYHTVSNWTTPVLASISATTDFGILKIWGIASALNASSHESQAIGWHANHTEVSANANVTISGLVPNQWYSLTVDDEVHSYVHATEAGTAVVQYSGCWSSSFFSLRVYSPEARNPDYAVRAPISIEGDGDFTGENGVMQGTGTPLDPFVIERWDISAEGETGIQIRNTTAVFVLQSCCVHDGGTDHDGIHLFNCTNGMLLNNSCIGNSVGMLLVSSSGVIISDNSCQENRRGMYLHQSCGNALDNNTFDMNSENGLCIDLYSDCNVIRDNHCSNNGEIGLHISMSNSSVLSGNTFSGNLLYGIAVDKNSHFNAIWCNSFNHNNGAGDTYHPSHVQACDDGTGNHWNSTYGCGNYWSDWVSPDADMDGIVDEPYDIAGSAGARDYYPSADVALIPEFNPVSLVVVLAAIIMLTTAAKRRKLGH